MNQAALSGLQKPNPKDLRILQEWMECTSMGAVYLLGQDSEIWSKPDKSDLVALRARHGDDLLTAWINDKAVHWWHRAIGKHLRVLSLIPLHDHTSFVII